MVHLTSTEMGREYGITRCEVIRFCMERGIPIFQGRIDPGRFAAAWSSLSGGAGQQEPSDD